MHVVTGARAKYEDAVVEALQMERIIKARALREYATPTVGVAYSTSWLQQQQDIC